MGNSKGRVQSNLTHSSNSPLKTSSPEDGSTRDCSLSNTIDIDNSLSQKLNEPFKLLPIQASLDRVNPGQDKTVANIILKDNKQQGGGALRDKDGFDRLAQMTMNRQVKYAGAIHPNFDTEQRALDPDRSLYEIPTPPPRYKQELEQLLALSANSLPQAELDVEDNSQQLEGVLSYKHYYDQASMWALIATPELASHLELLQLGGLINLPDKFFAPVKLVPSSSNAGHLNTGDVSTKADKDEHQSADKFANDKRHLNSPSKDNERLHITRHTDHSHYGSSADVIKQSYELLSSLTSMHLLDLSDIYKVCLEYPTLTRYGFSQSALTATRIPTLASKVVTEVSYSADSDSNNENTLTSSLNSPKLLPEIPEMINDVFAPNWEVILYPERFDNGIDSLTTDILACSAAVHILKQCQSRKSVNRSITVHQICQHMRSYVLSQCNLTPQFEQQYRNIRLFDGHIVMAACHLGLKVVQTEQHTQASIKSTGTTNATMSDDSDLLSHNLGEPIYINISSRASLLTRYPNISSYYINGWS